MKERGTRPGPGLVIPCVLAAALLLELAFRAVPHERIAIRAWEPMSLDAPPEAPFVPGKSVDMPRCWGPLANIANLPQDRVYHRERFSADALGFRRTLGVEPGEPVDAVLFGDSQAGGSGVSDDETLPSQLGAISGRAIYNAGGRVTMSTARMERICRLARLRDGGLVFFLLDEQHPVLVGARRAKGARAPVEPTGYAPRSALISGLRILVSRAVRGVEAAIGETGDERVVRAALPTGDATLFMRSDYESPGLPAGLSVPGFLELRDELAARGRRLVVLLLPSKATVYGSFLVPPVRVDGRRGALAAAARALDAAGVPAIDLTPALVDAARDGLARGAPVYPRDDDHWNAAGIRACALLLRDRVAW